MKTVAMTNDVFLSHGSRDKGLATLVRKQLSDSGLIVFDAMQGLAGAKISELVRDGLIESRTVVLLLTPASSDNRLLAYEVGKAIAFDKPIFVLHDGLRPKDIPEFLREFQLFPLSRLGSVANQISALKELPEAISG